MLLRSFFFSVFSLLIFFNEAQASHAGTYGRRKATNKGREKNKKNLKLLKKQKKELKCQERLGAFFEGTSSIYKSPYNQLLKELGHEKSKNFSESIQNEIQQAVSKKAYEYKPDELGKILLDLYRNKIAFSNNNNEKVKQAIYIAIENSNKDTVSHLAAGASKFYEQGLDEYIKEELVEKLSKHLENMTSISLARTVNTLKELEVELSNQMVSTILNKLFNDVSDNKQNIRLILVTLTNLPTKLDREQSKQLTRLLNSISNNAELQTMEEVSIGIRVAKRYFNKIDVNFVNFLVNQPSFDDYFDKYTASHFSLSVIIKGIQSDIKLTSKQKESFLKRVSMDSDKDPERLETFKLAKDLLNISVQEESDLSRLASIFKNTRAPQETSEVIKLIERGHLDVLNYLVKKYWKGTLSNEFKAALTSSIIQNIHKTNRPRDLILHSLIVNKESHINEEFGLKILNKMFSQENIIESYQFEKFLNLLDLVKFSDKHIKAHEITNFMVSNVSKMDEKSLHKLINYINHNEILPSNHSIGLIVDEVIKKSEHFNGREIAHITHMISSMNFALTKKLVLATYIRVLESAKSMSALNIGVYLSSIKEKCTSCTVEIWNRVDWSITLGNIRDTKVLHPIYTTLRYMETFEDIPLNQKGIFKELINNDQYFDNALSPTISRLQLNVEEFIREFSKGPILREYFIPDIVSHVDLLLPEKNLVIEIDGPTHYLINEQGESIPKIKDIMKNRLIEEKGIKVIHVPYYNWNKKFKEDLKKKILAI